MGNIKNKLKIDFFWLLGLKTRFITSLVLTLIYWAIIYPTHIFDDNELRISLLVCLISINLLVYFFSAWLHGPKSK